MNTGSPGPPNIIKEQSLVLKAATLNDSLEKVNDSQKTTYVLGIFARSTPSPQQLKINQRLSELQEGMRISIKEIERLKKEIKLIKNNSNLNSSQKKTIPHCPKLPTQ